MFVIEAAPADRLDAIRRTCVDDAGDLLRPFIAKASGDPLRCCLRDAEAGERLALVAFRPAGTAGAYRELGPIFVHADPCAGYPDPTTYPASFRDRRQVLRAYDHKGRIHDAVLVDGAAEAQAGIERLLTDPRIALVHSRNVLYGCYSFAIRRPAETLT